MTPSAEMDRDIGLHGFYRAAYPTRFFATGYFVKSVLLAARRRGHWCVIQEHGEHVYVTVLAVARRGAATNTLAHAVEN